MKCLMINGPLAGKVVEISDPSGKLSEEAVSESDARLKVDGSVHRYGPVQWSEARSRSFGIGNCRYYQGAES